MKTFQTILQEAWDDWTDIVGGAPPEAVVSHSLDGRTLNIAVVLDFNRGRFSSFLEDRLRAAGWQWVGGT